MNKIYPVPLATFVMAVCSVIMVLYISQYQFQGHAYNQTAIKYLNMSNSVKGHTRQFSVSLHKLELRGHVFLYK